ncbi:F0F1 ATP synthase subunit delta [Vibrio zhugei]|uniref:ATP synthase subunit delta n=1 Tax=Vibrio zhugei TaxID=2479546 RepID=A0ABV7C771_9VIBR|nr:F0F1 ATP synthase subunit delta [Vibrio zhugei]
MSELTEVARPYAKAAFDYALDNNALNEWQHMLDIAGMVIEQPIVKSYIDSAQETNGQAQLLDMFLQAGGELFDQYFQNFLKVMAENQRLTAVGSVIGQFRQLKEELDLILPVTVCVSEQLNDQQVADISQALSAKFGKTIELQQQIDPNLVGGIVIQANQMVFDGSVLTNLDRLSTNLHV